MPSSVRAQTTARSAIEPLVIQVFSPLITQFDPLRTARVRIPAGFDPKSGSVNPKASDRSARLEAGKPVGFLFFRAVLKDRIHDESALYRHETSKAGIAALNFLHDEPVFDIVHTGATVPFQIGAEKSQRGHFGD